MIVRLVTVTLLMALLATGPRAAEKPLVVASFYPLYEFARQVAGEHAEVLVLVPTGVEPHDWDPSPADLVRFQKARVFVYNGAGLEPWADKVIKEIGRNDLVVVRATAGLPLVRGYRNHDHEAKPSGKTGASQPDPWDPHVWLDPVLAESQVEVIRAALARIDPAHAQAYAANARAYRVRLAELHRAFTEGLKQCARRDVVVSHAAFGYLTRRYRLTQVGMTGISPEAEPSPADLATLAQFAKQKKVKYVFFETLVSSRLAVTLAREIGAQTLLLNPVEGLTKEEVAAGKSYVSVMEENLKSLRTGLDCR
jgi:zinc transport system substrate-binding protein